MSDISADRSKNRPEVNSQPKNFGAEDPKMDQSSFIKLVEDLCVSNELQKAQNDLLTKQNQMLSQQVQNLTVAQSKFIESFQKQFPSTPDGVTAPLLHLKYCLEQSSAAISPITNPSLNSSDDLSYSKRSLVQEEFPSHIQTGKKMDNKCTPPRMGMKHPLPSSNQGNDGLVKEPIISPKSIK